MPRMEIPVIGIGAGPATDGQVLVFHDLLGIREGLGARFVKRYADLQDEMVAGVARLRRGRAHAPLPRARARLLDRPATSCERFRAERWTRARSAAREPARRRPHALTARAPSHRVHTRRPRMARLSQVFAPRDREFFDLFEEAGAQHRCAPPTCSTRCSRSYPEREGARARHPRSASRRATGSRTTSSSGSTRRSSRRSTARTSSSSPRRSTTSSTTPRRSPTTSASTGSRRRWSRPSGWRTSCCRRPARSPRRCRGMRGFKDISHYTVEINRLENDGDRVVREAIAVAVRRRHRPDGRDPLEGHLRAPRAGDRRRPSSVANMLEGIVIKNS